jgi:ribosome biogenesis GTPase / thiamine phosphate phosphatase
MDGRPLADLGWLPEHELAFAPHAGRGLAPARVTQEHRGAYVVRSADGEGMAAVSGRFRFGAVSPGDFPSVGDWVGIDGSPADDGATIHALIPRRTAFTRLAAGRGVDDQVLAANVDVVFVVSALTDELNDRRLERYLAVAWNSGAQPVVVLTKKDLATDFVGSVAMVEAVAARAPVVAVAALAGDGLEELREWLNPGRTVAFLGSSGVGKSTLINALAGQDLLATAGVREDDGRGRHTTTTRQLLVLPGGALVIDTPGMRELALSDGGDGLDAAFDDIEALAAGCRFNDCAHEHEPGCAVQAAIADGSLSPERLRSRRKLDRELASLERRRAPHSRVEARRFGKLIRDAADEAMARKAMRGGW